jgi:hypothetical protein
MESHAKFALRELFHTRDLSHIFTVHGIVRRAVGKGYEHAHFLIVGLQPRGELDLFFGGVDANRQVFEVFIPGFGRAYADRPGHLRPAVASVLRVVGG